jgi:hypothetical protein
MASPDFLLNPQKSNVKFEQIYDESLSELKLETNSEESLEQITSNSVNESRTTESESPLESESSKEIQENAFQLNVIKQETSKKFFVKLVGYEPKFFHLNDETKKINEVIEDYLKTINININDIIKESFLYRGKRINLEETIQNIAHLSWITSNYIN